MADKWGTRDVGRPVLSLVDPMYFFAALRAGKLVREGRLIHVIPTEIPLLVRTEIHVARNLLAALCTFMAHRSSVRFSSLHSRNSLKAIVSH